MVATVKRKFIMLKERREEGSKRDNEELRSSIRTTKPYLT
jgi:hypothetical protein